jgi:CheY-like chemotaxis protein
VVVLSGWGASIEKEALAAGADQVLSKPVSLSALLAALEA